MEGMMEEETNGRDCKEVRFSNPKRVEQAQRVTLLIEGASSCK